MSAASPITIPGVGATIQFGTAQLAAGVAVVPCALGPNSAVFLQRTAVGGTPADVVVDTRVLSSNPDAADGSFRVFDVLLADASTFGWCVIGY